MLAEFEADTKAQSISNLYISSQVTAHRVLIDYMQSEEFAEANKDGQWTDFTANDANLKKLQHLEDQNEEQSKQAAPTQMSLGNRYQYGMSLDEDCESSTLYYEAAARQTIEFVEKTRALVGPERAKLNLMGPFALEDNFSFGNVISLEHIYTSDDVVELLDQ